MKINLLLIWFAVNLLPVPAQETSTSPVVPPRSVSCPITIRVAPIKPQNRQVSASGLHQMEFQFNDPQLSIIGYEGVFHGPDRNEVVGEALSSETEQSFSGGSHYHDRRLVSATHWTGKLAYVRWIEFTNLTFADGSEWHSSPTSLCIFLPEAQKGSMEP